MSVNDDLDNALDLDNQVEEQGEFNEYDDENEIVLEEEEDQDGEVVFEDDEDDDADEAAAKMPMKTKVMLGGLSILGVGLVGLVGATKLGMIGGVQQDVQWDQPAPQPEAPRAPLEVAPEGVDSVVRDGTLSLTEELPDTNASPLLDDLGVDNVGVTPVETPVTETAKDLPELNVAQGMSEKDIETVARNALSGDIEAINGSMSSLEGKQAASLEKINKVAKSIVSVRKEVATVKGMISSKGEVDLSGVATKDELNKAFLQLQELSGKVEKNSAKTARLSPQQVDVLLEGRTRLKGFKVVNATADGTMSVVVTPSKRVQVYFAGERFSVRGAGKMSVKSIHDNGHLLLVGSKYFIDDEYEPLPVRRTVVKKAKPQPKPVAVKKVQSKEQIASENFGRQPTINGKTKALGWSLNGSYVDGYLIQNPSGKWLTVKVGSKLEGLGMIEGADKFGNLIVGKFFIEKATD